MDTDYIVVSFGGYGMLVVWGAYGYHFYSLIQESLEPEAL